MTIRTTQIEPHWNYFLAIERELEALSRYVEFDGRNFRCFSLENARILLAAAAEADVVCKAICQAQNPASSADRINAYRDEVMSAFPGMAQFTVTIPRFGMELCPWERWGRPRGVPGWWTAYNKIKHERALYYHRASLRNVLNSVAGLFVATLYLYPERARAGGLAPSPVLLRPGPRHSTGVTVGDFGSGYNCLL